MANVSQVSDKDIAAVKHALRGHQGEFNRISFEDLTTQVYGEYTDTLRRRLREVVHRINTLPGERMILTDTKEGGCWLDDEDIMPVARNIVSEEGRKNSLEKKIMSMKSKAVHQWGRGEFEKALQKAREESKPRSTTFQIGLPENGRGM